MSKHHPDLLAEIEAFVAKAGMSEITFGRKAMSDPHFVRDLRNNRRLWPETEAKVKKWIKAQRVKAEPIAPRQRKVAA